MEKPEQVVTVVAPEPLLTTKEVAAFVGLSAYTLTRYRMDGIGPNYVHLGPKIVRYRRSDIEAWVDKMLEKKAD